MIFSKQYFIDQKDAEVAYNFRRLFIRTIFLIIIFFTAVYLINYNQKKQSTAGQLLAHTKDVIYHTEKTVSLVKDYETSARGFTISGKEEFLEPVKNTKDSIEKCLVKLKDYISDNPLQVSSADSLTSYIQKRLNISDYIIYLRRDSSLKSALDYVSSGTGKRCMDTIRVIEKNIVERENQILQQRSVANEKAVVINRITLFACLLLFFVLLIILFWQAWFNLKEYNNRQKEVNGILLQLAQGLMNAQKIAHLGSWEWNVDTGIEKWSDEQYRIFGYEPGSVNITHELFLNALHPGDRSNVESTIADAVNTQKPYNIYFRIIQPGGTIRHVDAFGEVYVENGKVSVVAGTIQDITTQVMKEKEKTQLAQVLDKTNKAARVGWWEADLLSGKRKWSSVTKEIMEVSEDFEPEGNFSFHFIKDAKNREKMEQAFSDAVLHGKAYDIEIDIVTAKGNMIEVRAIGQPEFEDGQCVRLYGIFQQLTLSKQQQPV